MKQNDFNILNKDGKFGIDLADSVLNTLCALELAHASHLITAT